MTRCAVLKALASVGRDINWGGSVLKVTVTSLKRNKAVERQLCADEQSCQDCGFNGGGAMSLADHSDGKVNWHHHVRHEALDSSLRYRRRQSKLGTSSVTEAD